MKHRRDKVVHSVAHVLLVLGFVLASPGTLAQDRPFPLEPADTSSPRSTLTNLVDNLVEVHRALEVAALEHESSSGLFMSDSVRDQEKHINVLLKRAVGSLDLSQVPRATRPFIGVEAAVQIKEVLDRVPLPPLESIPDKEMIEASNIIRWRIPHTGISITRIEEGPRSGEFLFDADAVSRSGEMYRTVRHLPYVNNDTGGTYAEIVATPGRLLAPKWLLWVDDLPAWMQVFHFGKAIWQWIALLLTLMLAFLVPATVSYWLRRYAEPESEFVQVLRRLAVPATALIALWFAEYILVWQINFTGQNLVVLLKSLLVPITLLSAYCGYLITLLVTETLISSPRIDTASLDANMLRMIASLAGGAIGIGIVFKGANDLGVPLVPLVASLGVGGLAVALAARPTIENLIGGIILYIDRPVSVGDFCSFGDHMGTVEAIGMRSIQLRARDRTIITVPNALFADMEIINWARCDMMQIRTTIGVRYETRSDQIRYLLVRLREMCMAHPRIDNGTARVRFASFGASSQDINIRVHALTGDWNEYFAIQEDILLRVGEIVEESGTGFAFPSRTLYVRRDDGLDDERGDAAVETVAGWRADGKLPFPNTTATRRDQLVNTLDYPPTGSPESIRPESANEEAAEPLSLDSEVEARTDNTARQPKDD